jgi:hypothetical protein
VLKVYFWFLSSLISPFTKGRKWKAKSSGYLFTRTPCSCLTPFLFPKSLFCGHVRYPNFYFYQALILSSIRVTGGIVSAYYQYISDMSLYNVSHVEGQIK